MKLLDNEVSRLNGCLPIDGLNFAESVCSKLCQSRTVRQANIGRVFGAFSGVCRAGNMHVGQIMRNEADDWPRESCFCVGGYPTVF